MTSKNFGIRRNKALVASSMVLVASNMALADTWTSGTNLSYINSNNVMVGIGLNPPTTPFHIRRDLGTSSPGEKTWMRLERNATTGSAGDPAFMMGYRVEGTAATRLFLGAANNKPLDFRTSSKPQAMTILDNGNVGIGKTDPAVPLEVNGAANIAGRLTLTGQNDQLQFQEHAAAGKQWRLGTAIGGSQRDPRDFQLWETDRGNLLSVRYDNGNVGIGNANPLHKLDVFGGDALIGGSVPTSARAEIGGGVYAHAGAYTDHDFRLRTNNQDRMAIDRTGRVGIGTMTPVGRLHITGNENDTRIIQDAGSVYTEMAERAWGSTWGLLFNAYKSELDQPGGLFNSSNTRYKRDRNGPGANNRAAAGLGVTLHNTDGGIIQFYSAPPSPTADATVTWTQTGSISRGDAWLSPRGYPEDFFVSRTGHVGIGTSAPSDNHVLDVNGNVKVSGNINVASVTTRTWTVAPDYVFEKDYKLKSLGEVEAFVQKNKHLPEVPSAKEFKEKGMDLAEMNFALLKKVEELTLHAIRQEKEMKRQAAHVERQAAEMAKQAEEIRSLKKNYR